MYWRVAASLLITVCLLAAPLSAAQTSIWEGPAGWLAVAPAQFNPGEHGVGDIVIEVEQARRRTGRITSDIVLRSEQHGEVNIAAGTPVVANRQTYLAVGGGQPTRNILGGIEWCTIAETQYICIAQPSAFEGLFARDAEPTMFVYTEYAAPARLSGRIWRGGAPLISEERIAFEPAIRKQLIVREIAASGVLFTLRTIRNDESTDVIGPEPIAYGTLVHDSHSDVAFRFRRGRRGRIILEAAEQPED